jgi:DNA-binding MarR family transcriptional regulator
MDERVQRIQRILDCSGTLIHNLNPGRESAWLNVDLTMPQLKTLIRVTRTDGATSGQVATTLGVSLSTITGIVDRLAEQGFVTRQEDPRDRRITRVLPTTRGRDLVEGLLQYREAFTRTLLSRLDADQLETVERAFEYLVQAVDSLQAEQSAKEAVA